jgi:hypothetical protein
MLETLWYCGRGYNQSSYSKPLPSYVRRVFTVPEMILQVRTEEDVSTRVIGRCFGSLLAKKLAQDVTNHPQRYLRTRTGTGFFVTQAELVSLSMLLETTSANVMDWLGRRGAISLANIVVLVTSETELLVSNQLPSEALDILQKTLEILVNELPHPSTDLSNDLAMRFCKLYSKIDNAWGTIWLKYELRPIHERLLGTNPAYSSAWSRIQASDSSHPSAVGAGPWARNYLASDRAGPISETWSAPPNEIGILPTGAQSPLDDLGSVENASVASLFPSPTLGVAMSAVLSLGDPELESSPVVAYEQAEARTTVGLEQIPELTAGIRRGSREVHDALVEPETVPDNDRT